MNKYHTLKSKQSGAALGVGLIMLLVMTLLGVTNMSRSTLELRMAANAQNKNHAFQAVSSNIDNFVATGYQELKLDKASENIVLPAFHNPTSSVTSKRPPRYKAKCPAGISGAYDLDKFECSHFQIEFTGEHTTSGSRSLQTQGVAVASPKLSE